MSQQPVTYAASGVDINRQDEALACQDAGEVCVWGGSGLLLEVYFLHRRDRDTDPAIRALARRRERGAMAILCERAGGDLVWWVRRAALYALGQE